MYSYITNASAGAKKCKGIKTGVVKTDIKHENYRDILFNNTQMHDKMRTIRSDHHAISTYELNKVSLSCFDDKRYILSDGISSLPYGPLNRRGEAG